MFSSPPRFNDKCLCQISQSQGIPFCRLLQVNWSRQVIQLGRGPISVCFVINLNSFRFLKGKSVCCSILGNLAASLRLLFDIHSLRLHSCSWLYSPYYTWEPQPLCASCFVRCISQCCSRPSTTSDSSASYFFLLVAWSFHWSKTIVVKFLPLKSASMAECFLAQRLVSIVKQNVLFIWINDSKLKLNPLFKNKHGGWVSISWSITSKTFMPFTSSWKSTTYN